MNPILPADVEPVLDADAFVCVPITDYEVGQPTLRYIKENGGAPVVLDAHGPTVTLTRSGQRHPRVWADRDLWLPYIDILKMNLEEATRKALEDLALGESGSQNLEREADLVFNPFPATLVVRVPTEPLIVEGFTREEKGRLVAQTEHLLEAVASLEGRWISPDPLAFAIRSDSRGLTDLAPVIAAVRRRAEAVIGEREVADALRERLQPATRYRVRFLTRAASREP